jgi:uncharacterized protein (TIGR00290 family)
MWSGGKDSALAVARARRAGLTVDRFVTFFESATGRVRFHGVRAEVLRAHAAAAGAAIDLVGTTWPQMEAALDAQLDTLRQEGYAGVVFGDIHLADVRAWYESRVTNAGLEHVEPLWGEPPAVLLREFVESGARAVVTCVDLSRLDRSWLGRVIDLEFVDDVGATGIDPCGENGEFHSFIYAGPPLAYEVAWRAGQTRVGQTRAEDRFPQLDIVVSPRDRGEVGRA